MSTLAFVPRLPFDSSALLRFLICLTALCGTLALTVKPQETKKEKPNFGGQYMSSQQFNDADIQRLTKELKDARESSDKWGAATTRLLWVAALVAVLIGVTAVGSDKAKSRLIDRQDELASAKELKRDAEKREADQRLEEERRARVEIEDRVAWRRLTKNQQSNVGTRLKPFAGQLSSLWYNAGDHEGALFASDIFQALKAANWEVFAPNSKLDFGAGGSKGPPVIEAGVIVVSTKDEPSQNASMALLHELESLGFDAKRSERTQSQPTPRVFVEIEARPEGPQGEGKLRRLKTAQVH